jgi:hypothetical protein
MKGALVLLLAAAAGAGTLSYTRDAHALGPIDLEIGAKVGAGTNPTGDKINPLGFGLGGRAGVGIFGIYAGVSAMYYFGGSVSDPNKRTGKAVLYGAEAGYTFNLAFLELRPQLGVGVYNGNFSPVTTSAGTVARSTGDGRNIYLEPGLTGIIPIGIWFVGADVNLFFLPGQTDSKTAFTFHGQVGLKL